MLHALPGSTDTFDVNINRTFTRLVDVYSHWVGTTTDDEKDVNQFYCPQKISKHQRALLLVAFVLVLCASAVKGVAAARRGEGAHRAAARLGPVARQHHGLEPVRAMAIAHGVTGGFEGEESRLGRLRAAAPG